MPATEEEIERRVHESDAPRTARRAVVSKRVGELAQRRAAVAEQLSDVERELGDVLAESTDVIEIDEVARFTDIPAADLNRWQGSRKTARPNRKKPAGRSSSAKSTTRREPSTGDTQKADQASARREPSVSRDGSSGAPEPVTAEVG